jgi:hypothetical protein
MLPDENCRLKELTSLSSLLVIADLNAYMGISISDGEIDGIIGSEWDDAGNYPDFPITPQGNAEIWTKHDGTHLYIAVQFNSDSANPWVAFQFGNPEHMSQGADGAIFGHDRLAANEYRDISFGGVGSISADANQDGVGAIRVEASNLVTVELKKPLSSGDSAGDDIGWVVGDTNTLIIMWDSNGGGSSGGNIGHTFGFGGNRTIFINPDIPEFPGSTLIIVLVATTILASFFKRRTKKAS